MKTTTNVLKQTATFLGRKYSAKDLNESDTTDCLITSRDGNSFPAHYALLEDWLGNVPPITPQNRQIFLPISFAALQLLLDIVYYRKTDYSNNVLELTDYALDANWMQLVDNLIVNGYEHIENAGLPRCWILAHTRKIPCELELRKKIADIAPMMIWENQDGCQDLLSTPIDAFLDLLRDDKVCWDNGRCLLDVILAWSQSNIDVAKTYCRPLFASIRFKTIEERRQCINKFRTFFMELGMSEFEINHATLIFSSAKRRLPRSLILYTGGWSVHTASGTSYLYDSYNDQWSIAPKVAMKMKLSNFGIAINDKALYAIGSYNDLRCKTYVWKFDFETFQWIARASMPEIKGRFATASDRNYIYTIGGSSGCSPNDTVDRYDVLMNQWQRIPSLITGRIDAAALSYRNCIWVFGGLAGLRRLNSVESFDPSTNTWTEESPMLETRSGHCVVHFQEKFYVMGGYTHGSTIDTVERYDPVQCHWSSAPKMLTPRMNFSAVVYDNDIYIMGGLCGKEILSTCEKFDGKAWTQVHCLPKNIASGAAVIIDNSTLIDKLIE